jgi:hypothetical protein
LIDISLRWVDLPLELQNEDAPRSQENRIRSSELERQFVLKNRGIAIGRAVCSNNLANLALQCWNAIRPRTFLLYRDIADKVSEALANGPRGRRRKEWKS